jgi:hypothetical protein
MEALRSAAPEGEGLTRRLRQVVWMRSMDAILAPLGANAIDARSVDRAAVQERTGCLALSFVRWRMISPSTM